MSEIKRYQTTRRHSRVVVHRDIVYLSGITARDRTLDVRGQTRDVLEQIDVLLASVGSDRTRLLTAEIWLKDVKADFEAVTAIYEDWMPEGHAPARGACSADMAAEDIKVEIWVTGVC